MTTKTSTKAVTTKGRKTTSTKGADRPSRAERVSRAIEANDDTDQTDFHEQNALASAAIGTTPEQEQLTSHVSAILAIEPTDSSEGPSLVDASLTSEQHAEADAKVEVATKQPKPMPTLTEAFLKARFLYPQRYANVDRVVELTAKGEPKRVVIVCGDPQTKQEGGVAVSVCQGEREIAVQDLFQVTCCASCADRKVRKARRNRAKARAKAAAKVVRALKAGKA